MEIKSTITAIVSAIVALVIVVVVAIPIITDISDDVHTESYNDSIRFYANDGINEPVTIAASGEGITVNGEYIGISSTSVISLTNESTINFVKPTNTMELWANNYTTIKSITYNPDNTYTYITANNGTGSGTWTDIIHADPDGDYAMFTGVNSIEIGINHNATYWVEARGYTEAASNCRVTYIVDNGTAEKINSFGNAESSYEAIPTVVSEGQYSDIVRFSSSMTIGDTTINGATISVFAPATYTVVTASDNAVISIIQIITLLMIVGIIIAVTAAFIRTQ